MDRIIMIRYFLYLLFMIFIFYLLSFNSASENKCYLKKRRSRNLLSNVNIEDLSNEQKTIRMLIKRSIMLESRLNEIEHKLKYD